MKKIEGVVNWGIIGCGDVCEKKSGPAFNKVTNSQLVAVMRRDEEKAADYARRHKVPKYYTDASQLISDPYVNAIYVATPPSSHLEYMEQALKAGKPVYVEKPVTTSVEMCRKMIDIKNKYGGFVSVAHYRRGLELFNEVKNMISQGVIGDVTLVRIETLQPKASKIITQTSDNWRIQPEISGGGFFHDLSPHQLDICYWLFGTPVKFRGNSLNQKKLYDAPDVVTVEAEYPNGVLLQGVWAFNVSEHSESEYCTIYGSKGHLGFSFFVNSALEIVIDLPTVTRSMHYPENIQQPMIDSVVKYFKGQEKNPCSLEDALVTMEMIDSTVSR